MLRKKLLAMQNIGIFFQASHGAFHGSQLNKNTRCLKTWSLYTIQSMCFFLEHLIFLFQRLELCQPFLSVYLNHSDHVVSTAQIALLTASFLSSSGQMYAMLNIRASGLFGSPHHSGGSPSQPAHGKRMK